MRPRQPPTSPRYPTIRFAFTDHPSTGWTGAILLRLYFELIGLRAMLAPWLVPFTKTSNNQIPAVDLLLAWWYGLALGAERFGHMTRYRRDPLLPPLRTGRVGTPNGAREFLAQALTMLPPGHQIGLVRADSGFCVAAFLAALEVRELPYIIVARLTPLVRKLVIHRIPEADQRSVTRGIAVADMTAALLATAKRGGLSVCARP